MQKLQTPLFLISLAIGCLLAIQLQSEHNGNASSLANQETTKIELMSQLNSMKNQQKEKVIALQQESSRILRQESPENQEELALWEQKSGVQIAEGGGVVLTYNTTEINALALAQELRSVVQALFQSEASAIAINNERVLFNSPIIASNNIVLLDGTPISAPFTISAIGDEGFLISALETKPSLEDIRQKVIQKTRSIDLSPKKKIVIPAKPL